MDWITCEDTYEECWSRLLEFANVDLAIEAISNLHGPAGKKNRKNYEKQASQIRVSLLQSKEYFEAARASSLFTRPNHIYYGAAALASACMLIRGDGRKALDSLRLDKSNSHHGLDFSFSLTQSNAQLGFNLLENSRVKICPRGFFNNWYKTLKTTQGVPAILKRNFNNGSTISYQQVAEYDISEFSDLENQKYTFFDIVKRLPDLNADFKRYGIDVDSCRGTYELTFDQGVDTRIGHFNFYGVGSDNAMEKIIDVFDCDDGVNFCVDWAPGGAGATVHTNPMNGAAFRYPDSRETLSHQSIFYAEVENFPEIVDLYMASYCLSMLSRYYPDIWVSFLESHCKGAKLVERICGILLKKIPNLMLNQMADRQYVISTHRPFWH